VCSHYIIYLDNEGDGEGFLLLTDEDIGDIVKPLGAMCKFITERNIQVLVYLEENFLYFCSQKLKLCCTTLNGSIEVERIL